MLFQADRGNIQAGTANHPRSIWSLTAELTGRADIHASSAESTLLGSYVKRGGDLSGFPSVHETDGFAGHLLGAHSDT